MRLVERAAAAAFVVLIYTVWCVFIGASARSKSYSFWAGFWPSFLLTPIIGSIVVGLKAKPTLKAMPPPVSPDERRYPCDDYLRGVRLPILRHGVFGVSGIMRSLGLVRFCLTDLSHDFTREVGRLPVRFYLVFWLCLAPCVALAQAPSFTVDEAVSLAVKNNPLRSAALREVAAAESGVRSAKALANPEIAFAPGITSPSGSSDELLILQPLEINGTRTARSGVARAQLRLSEAQAAVSLQTLVFETRSAYYELVRARERLALARELLSAAEEFDRIANRQVELGKRAGIERTQTGIEVIRARQQVFQAEGQELAALAALNTQMGRKPSEPVGALFLPPYAPVTTDKSAALRDALLTRPEIKVEEAGAESFRQEARLVRAQGLPDLAPQFRAGSVTRGFSDYGFGVAVSLPIFDYGSRRNRVRQSEEAARAQTDRVQAARNQVQQAVTQALARLTAAQTVLKEYPQGLLDQTKKLLDASRTGFQEGQTSVITLLEAQRTYRTVQNEYVNAQVDYALAIAELDRASGSSTPSFPPAVPEQGKIK